MAPKNVRIYDPAMCCSTGVCGPSVDPRLSRFAADLEWLKGQGVSVERFTLSQQPGEFAKQPSVKAALLKKGEASLPIVMVDGKIESAGVYPSRGELAAWAGVSMAAEAAPSVAPKTSCCGPRAKSGKKTAGKSKCC